MWSGTWKEHRISNSLPNGDKSIINGYTDADWDGDIEERKSTSGVLIRLGTSPITSTSKNESTVALSSTEAEYRALAKGAKETIWLRYLLQEFGYFNGKPIEIFNNNQRWIKIAKNPIFHARTKHIEFHYYFTREKILAGGIEVNRVLLADHLADILTKSLGRVNFEEQRESLNILDLGDLQNYRG